MPRGRPKILSVYEKTKSRKIREFLSDNNISRFDSLHDAALLDTVRISDGRVFVSLDHHNDVMQKIAHFVDDMR